ncbi:hypothetical protein Bra1253DRAFT_01606 [Bradyrhizobium sp. WSM1253]|nr:hypothetical protein Bra1253DRAFT_01606 [Bradyrhizobium sp. WSM1253]
MAKDPLPTDTVDEELRILAEVVVFARDVRDLGDLPARPGWRRLEMEGWRRLDPDSRVATWTTIMPTFSAPFSTASSAAD